MHPEPNPYLTQEQKDKFNRHIQSSGVNLQCPYCGSRYDFDRANFESVPGLLNDQQTPVSWTRPLVGVTCTNCRHKALFDVPIDPASGTDR
jgi:DNA-directed RNA polymerase subunit RPC12/RpoP